MNLRIASRSHVGRVRSTNQDRLLTHDRLFAVADGMGGHNGGDIAAEIAIETLARCGDPSRRYDPNFVSAKSMLEDAFADAHRAIVLKAGLNPALALMGTTLTAAVVDEDGFLSIGHAGDSRGLLLRQGVCLELCTKQSTGHRLWNVLGHQRDSFKGMEYSEHKLQVGDRIILASDGLEATCQDIENLKRIAGTELVKFVTKLVEHALSFHGGSGRDNITVIVAEVLP